MIQVLPLEPMPKGVTVASVTSLKVDSAFPLTVFSGTDKALIKIKEVKL